MKENVKIPGKHYVGLIKRSGEKLPLAFITPWGEDSASKKRIETVDSWVRGNGNYRGSSKMESQIIENTPLIGFKLGDSIRSSGYGGYDKWRIEDPRGFELEITSGNLAQLLSVSMIDKGEILDQCVWARHGKDNILLSTNTDNYKKAVENTKVAGSSASWKDVKLGDIVVLQNNIKGIWFGRMHYLTKTYSSTIPQSGDTSSDELESSSNMVHIIHVNEASYDCTSTLYMLASPKLSSIEHCETPLTKIETEIFVNKLLSDSTVSVSQSGYKTPKILSFNVLKPTEHYTLNLVEIDIPDTTALGKERQSNFIFADIEDDVFGLCSHNDNINHYSKNSLSQNKLCRSVGILTRETWQWRSDAKRKEMLTSTFEFSSIKKFYHLEITAKTPIGNEIICKL